MTSHPVPVEAAIQVFLDRFDVLIDDWSATSAKLEDLQKALAACGARQAQIKADVDQLQSAATLLGFDMFAEHDKRNLLAASDGSDIKPSQPMAPLASTAFKVKDWVLQAVKDAYPEPVRATELRARLREQGHDIHDKTIGMTLYRWLKRGKVSRTNLDWYYEPEPLVDHDDRQPMGGLF